MIFPLPIYILAGGRSSRFGSDKAMATIDGESLLARLIERLALVGSEVTVVSRRGERYSGINARCIEDEFDFRGPLAGVLRCLKDNVGDASPPWRLIVSCDLLDWHDVWLEKLQSDAEEADCRHREKKKSPLAIVFHHANAGWEPFPGLYHRELLPVVESLLEEEKRSMRQLLNDERSRTLAVEFGRLPKFRTANTREELKRWVEGE